MKELSTTTPEVHLHDGKLTTSSLNIAKRHRGQDLIGAASCANRALTPNFMGIRGLSDLMLNMEKEHDLHAVRPENLQVLLDLLADKLEAAIGI